MGLKGQIVAAADLWIEKLDSAGLSTEEKLEMLDEIGQKVDERFGDLRTDEEASLELQAAEAPESEPEPDPEPVAEPEPEPEPPETTAGRPTVEPGDGGIGIL